MYHCFKQILLIIALLNTSDLTSQDIQKLESNWQYKSNDSMEWLPCHIPNSIYKMLFDSLIISDPFYSNNEESLQFIGHRDYQFQTSFNIGTQTLSRRIQELHLTNIDTYADIYLNEVLIGQTNNAFRTWKFDISKQLKLGLNNLRINLKSADRISKELYNQLPYQLPGGERVTSRKPQFHFGWDFGPKYLSCGILSVPLLTSYDDVELSSSSVHTKELRKSHAHIELNLEINSAQSQIIKLQWSLDNQLFTNTLNLTEGKNNIKINAKLKNPKLWWPNGSGDAFLYDTRLQLINSENKIILVKHFNSGIRVIKLIHKQDKWGKSFYFNINGVDIFAKGANYIPQDIFQLENHPVHKILNDAYECGFNMLRVWGGGQYESDEFYETCDKLGIIIWQDFMFACAMYPGDKSFNNNIQIEAEEQIKRLSRFSCIGLWCGNNENNEAWHRWGWQIGLGKDTKERLWSDYQNLFNNILPDLVKLYSNNNSYWESSPLYGRGDPRFQTEGDAHDWGIWHDEMKFESFEQRVPRFMSEAGFQSLPSLSTILSFCPKDELNLESKSMLAHQKHPRGNKLIQEYLQRDLPQPNNFENLIYLNQLNQAEGMGIAINAHRRAKPYCMGTLYWQYNDCWPGLSWSSRDYFGHWKALQHKTKELYQPLLVSTKVFVTLVAKYY